jgi:hypothetical protein
MAKNNNNIYMVVKRNLSVVHLIFASDFECRLWVLFHYGIVKKIKNITKGYWI